MTSTDAEPEMDIDVDKAPPMILGLMGTRIGFRLRILQALLGERVVAGLAPYKMRSGSFTTMALIAANPGCSQADVAREGGLDKSAVVAIVDELEDRGLAARGRSRVDRRRNTLWLTPPGEVLMNEMYGVAHGTEQSIREGLTPEELTQFFSLLERAYQIVAEETQSSEI